MSERKTTTNDAKLEVALKKAFGERWGFYRDGYYKMFKLLIFSIVIILIEALAIAYLAMRDAPVPKYFTTDANGNIAEIIPTSRPLSDKAVTSFVEEAIENIYTLNFSDHDQVINDAQEFFTDQAWLVYKKSTEENLLPAIIESNLVMTTSKLSAAQIISKSTLKGRQLWTVEIDVVRTLSDRSNKKSKTTKYRVTVIRESENIRPRKLAILSITDRTAGGALQ